MPELETKLAREREGLLDAIEQPPLERIGSRAASIRYRRRARRAGAALTVLAVAGFAGVRAWAADEPPPVADPSPPPGVVYTDAGITINGLTGEGFIDPPGRITDVEFADPDRGYALLQCRDEGKPCAPGLARTADGGITWTLATLPPGLGSRIELTAFPDGRVVVGGHVTADAGQTWQPTARATGPAATIEKGQLLRLGDGGVEVWSSQYGNRGALATQPDMNVDWVAGAPTATGAWWVGGVQGQSPAVAVTRDGGRTWKVTPLAAAGSTAQVSVLGEHVYAIAIGAGRAISAIYLSVDSGQRFARTTTGRIAEPAGLAGEAVPLLDGRLLVTGTDQRWYLSEDDGRTFTQADGTLPAVGHVFRTPAGYVAYELFRSGWAAYSADGSTWRKLQVN